MKPLATNNFIVSDALTFVHEIASLKPNPTDVFVSYDVVSLFTSVPLDDTIEYIVKKALVDDWLLRSHGLRLSGENLSKLLNAASRDKLFSHNGQLYEQFEGVAMGSPLGPLMANACMCMLEEKLVQDGRLPSFCRRYIDCTLAIFPSLDAHENFFAHLNALHPSIRFTVELNENGILPFIGVNCHLDSSGVQTSVYHKLTDIGLLLHYRSHIDQKYKQSLLRTMIHRAYKMATPSR